jgi:uncharacterized protein YbaR (Trm112 family)
MDRKLLDILCCPASKQPWPCSTRPSSRRSTRRSGPAGSSASTAAAVAPLKEGLITRDHQTVYRIEDGIPVLLSDEGIATAPVPGFPR